MVLIRAYGHNAAVDLFEHHLVITRRRGSMLFDAAASEQFIPLSSIKSVEFHPAGLVARGRMILTLAGNPSRHPGTESDVNTVFFAKGQADQFKQIVHAIRDAIATPSLEQLAMAAQRNRGQDRVSQAHPAQRSGSEPTRNTLQRIDDLSSSHGGGYGNAGSSGPYEYYRQAPRQDTPPHDPIASLPTGGWWQDMPLAGKIILIAVIVIAVLAMCSRNEGATPDAGEQASSAATGEASGEASEAAFSPAEVPPAVSQLVMDGDSRACADSGIIETVRNILLPDGLRPEPFGLTPAELRKAERMATTVITQVTMDDIRDDIHEIRCIGKLDYGDSDATSIEFTLRPTADQSGDVMVFVKDQPLLTGQILEGPVNAVRSQRPQLQPQAPQQPANSGPMGRPTPRPAEPTEDDLYAPHSN
ncbi:MULTISPECIES: hypothetical protein [unclassified Novosphingobium]|uniref:hypothetical protein n=1 Tax=unclassified Novosphingobium TaxID=2644732 RepID=UPI00061BA76C|nr:MULTISPECIES: hypothetical protein [unclassified Novosphingobium]GAO54985.1 hypothetical protein NMD1_02088 [Novosphingobium sp. MD-1]